jgi:hypothetical protein
VFGTNMEISDKELLDFLQSYASGVPLEMQIDHFDFLDERARCFITLYDTNLVTVMHEYQGKDIREALSKMMSDITASYVDEIG